MNELLRVEFNDCDAYFDAINDVNVRFTLQGLESSRWRINVLTLPSGINIQHCLSGSGSVAQGVSHEGGFELAIPASGHYSANGVPVPLESVLLMVPESEFLVAIPKAHSWFGVFIPQGIAESIGLPESPDGRLRKRTQVLVNTASGSVSVPSFLTRFVTNAFATAHVVKSQAVLAAFERELLAVLGKAYGNATGGSARRTGRKPVIDHTSVNRALDVIEASPEPNVAMSALVSATEVSERSLRAGFQKFLGMSPRRYMQLCTLNRARRRLARSQPGEASVAEVVTDLGVWDLGRFAARYRQLFGELPSSTLRRAG